MCVSISDILKIDHLWVLPNLVKLSLNFNKIDRIENIEMLVNLKELDLSFNFIEKIENLETLVKLETLSLFNNSIKVIENLDNLTNLIILSIGRNKIDSFKGVSAHLTPTSLKKNIVLITPRLFFQIERFRFFKKLRSLNLQGNPIDMIPESPLRIYIAAVLPQLKYYEYIFISEVERALGGERYLRELREIQENEQDEIVAREKLAKERQNEIQLSDSFVELLNEHQLFDSFFVNDEDGKALLSIGEKAADLISDYRKEAFNLTQKIYNLGLEKHEIRLNELKIFKTCVVSAKLKVQEEAQQVVQDYLTIKVEIFAKAREYLTKIETETSNTLDDPSEELIEISEKFQMLTMDLFEILDGKWEILMGLENSLFERVEESNTHFGHTIAEMMNEFIEQAQTLFVQLRDAESNFCDSLQEAVTRYITFKMASKDEQSVPKELQECLDDKDAIMNLIAGMRDLHMQRIDAREDKLISRARGWISDLTTNLHKDEISRNRNKVMEINYFLDQQRDEFDRLQEEIRDSVLKKQDDE